MNKCQICRKTCEGSCCHSCEIRLGQALSSILDYYQLAKSQMMPVKGDGVSGGERSLGIRVSALVRLRQQGTAMPSAADMIDLH